MVLKTSGTPPCPEAELLLYEADRAQHVALHIRPWLEKKVWVLSDRFGDSSVAFQGAGRKIPREKVQWLNTFATQDLVPDMTIIVDCPVEVSQARRKDRVADRFEAEDTAFHQAVRSEYLAMAKTHPRFLLLDGTKNPQTLLEDLVEEVKKRKFL
jgi:dTMP kinase